MAWVLRTITRFLCLLLLLTGLNSPCGADVSVLSVLPDSRAREPGFLASDRGAWRGLNAWEGCAKGQLLGGPWGPPG